MNVPASRLVATLVVLTAAGSGCSYLFVDRRPENYQAMPVFACTGGRGFPIADSVVGSIYAVTAVVTAVQIGGTTEVDGSSDSQESRITTALASAAIAGLMGSSAYYGFKHTSACREAQAESVARWQREARQPAFQPFAPPPLGPPGAAPAPSAPPPLFPPPPPIAAQSTPTLSQEGPPPPSAAPAPPAAVPAGWPPLEALPPGRNEVRVRNPNTFAALVGVRAGAQGRDFTVRANDVASIWVPDGRYEIYFNYSTEPAAVYQGDAFSLASTGIEIRIVQQVGGNYGIKRVK